ncbi:MAG: thioesterase family protein [Candidatus Omnitrophica bacterium]|nr:thioesterase family protein [Candidatus Omnitrophota bacterium]MDD5671863.1 thioesterase family protein [Candidatus Omnitrophota bacterium]
MDSFDYEYRVRYADTDKMGISYYANYFVWFEAARTEYFRALGLPYTECERQGYFLPVVEAGAQYHAPCTYDDWIVVRTAVSELGKTSMRFEYQVLNKAPERLLATGFTVHVFVNRAMKPRRVPPDVTRLVTPFRLIKAGR